MYLQSSTMQNEQKKKETDFQVHHVGHIYKSMADTAIKITWLLYLSEYLENNTSIRIIQVVILC